MIASIISAALLCATGDLLLNPGFDGGLAPWKSNSSEVSTEAVRDGDRTAARLTVPAGVDPGFPGLYQEFPAKGGDLLELRLNLKAEGVSGGHGVYGAIEYYPESGGRLSYSQSDPVRGDTGWTDVLIRGVVPPETARARVVLLVNGHGSGLFDSIQLTRAGNVAATPLDGPVTVTVTDEVVCKSFRGFGFEDDGWFFSEENRAKGVNDDDFALKQARVEWMDPDRVRMFFWIKDYCPSGDWETFTFDSPNMASHYRTLDLYQRLGTDVNVTGVEWGFDQPYDDVKKAAFGIATLLDHLIRTKGYTCVKSWTLTNEPNGSWVPRGDSFEQFEELTRLVKEELAHRELSVQIVGSDDTAGFPWFKQCVESDTYYASADYFASHRYFPYADRLLAPFFFQERLDLLASRQPRKDLTVEEFGFQDARSATMENPLMMTYPYAIWSTAFAIEGLNLGVAGFSIWALHEVYYPGGGLMEYALWEFKDDQWKVRPVYHAWANFCRLTEKGDPVRRCESSSPAHVVAARVGDTLFWVNRSDQAVEVRLAGMPLKDVRIHTEDTLRGDRECGTVVSLNEGAFTAPAQSFGYSR